jgi:hypothetical protein
MMRLTKDAISRETRVPSIIINVNGWDEREYEQTSAKASLDAFIESLLATKSEPKAN